MQRNIRTLVGHIFKNLPSRFISNTYVQHSSPKFIRSSSQSVTNQVLANNKFKKKSFTITDFIEHVNAGKLYYLKQLMNIFHSIKFENLSTDEAILILKVCGSAVPDSSRQQRNSVCQDIFDGLKKANNINVNILNKYIKTCTQNSTVVDSKELLSIYEPNQDTYKLLLENASECGLINESFNLLEIMKIQGIPLDGNMLSNMVLAHTINGGLKLAESVLSTIRTVQIAEDNKVKLALFKGLIRRKGLDEFKKALKAHPVCFNNEEFLTFLEEIGLNGSESWLNEAFDCYKDISITRDMQAAIEKICIHLVHMERPLMGMHIYERFVEPQLATSFGLVILKEMLHCNIDIDTIISLGKSLVERELNLYILENLTELALKYRYEEQAWVLLKNLLMVRPHYFWPLLLQSGRSKGELGIFDVIRRIRQEFSINFDSETLENYIFPYCDLSNLKLLMLRLQESGFTVREILSPLLMVLLKKKRTKRASDLCNFYNSIAISGERFLPLLAESWNLTKDTVSIIVLLARYCESNAIEQDLVGTFLVDVAKHCQNENELPEYIKLINGIARNGLKTTIQAGKAIQDILQPLAKADLDLESSINKLVDFGLNIAEDVFIPHPSSMNLEGLECHLIELQGKNMETRGVLRKLIQMHANKGNVERVKELRELFLKSGYEESPGVKSSIMHSYVIGKHLDEAMLVYDDLKQSNPQFALDSFKFIDLVKLIIENGRFEEGFHILEEEISNCKIINVSSIQRNCRELLLACETPEQLDKIFGSLLKSGLGTISNHMLGPLVRIHLKNDRIDKAVEKYVELSKKYNCTPLQFELLRAVTKNQNYDQLQQVLKATEAIHGPAAAQVGLIAALAENRQEKALINTLMNSSQIEGLLLKRCQRWTQECKIDPLQCLASAISRLPRKFISINFVYKCIFDIYDLTCDYKGALAFYDDLPEEARSMDLEKVVRRFREKYKIEGNEVQNKISNEF